MVLIEAYWNVNSVSVAEAARALNVLIEAYWNVNREGDPFRDDELFGFNRSILKCKFRFALFFIYFQS